MDKVRICRVVFMVMLVVFSGLYISQATGYYTYDQYQNKALTDEAIKQFEKDVKDGKNVDITNYTTKSKNYNNGVSNVGRTLSKGIEKYTKQILGGTFKMLNKLINES